MNATCVSLLVLMFFGRLAAQTYTYTQTTGEQPYTASIRPSASLLLKGPANQVLSSWQQVPFDCTFYGEPVTGYYASDNGYITFDSSARGSVSPVGMVGGTTDPPNNCIYGFWEELALYSGQPAWSHEVRSITIGTAPNRYHVVMWISAVSRTASSTSGISFAIVLKEAGGFAIVQVAGNHNNTFAGSIGAENADGTNAVFVDGSGSLDFPPLGPMGYDDVTYDFTFTTSLRDLAIKQIVVPPTVIVGSQFDASVVVTNSGAEAITLATVQVQADGIEPMQLLLNKVLASGHSDTLQLGVKISAASAGAFITVTAAIVDVNGEGADDRPSNDVLSTRVMSRRGVSVPRRPLVEEFTGAWCGWCPDGALIMKSIEQQYPQAVLVAIHANQVDSMVIPTGQELATMYRPSFPTAMIDRTKFDGSTGVPISRSGGAWQKRVAEQLTKESVVLIAIEPRSSKEMELIAATVRVTFVDDVPADRYSLHVWLTEDGISKPIPGYRQRNYYSSNPDYPYHPLYSQPPYIDDWQHNHVLRESFTGTFGDTLIIPFQPVVGDTYSLVVSTTALASYIPENSRIVAFVARHHSTDNTQRQVLNAQEAIVLGKTSSVEHEGKDAKTIYPNPSSKGYFRLLHSEHAVVADLMGRVLWQGGGDVQVDCSAWPSGVYVVRQGTATTLLTVMR